jgi:hypothetical protein
MKKIPLYLAVFLSCSIYAQDAVDIGTPTNAPFNLGNDIQGAIQNSVNEVTGKVTLSVPLAAIASGSGVSYSISLGYNGANSFKNGQQTNKYSPTSVVGVGWSIGTPKIVVDNKETGTRDDDVFYLLDGATNTKLICTNRGITANGSVWEFQTEKYALWKIKFYYSNSNIDHWEIIKEDGLTYYFGKPNAQEARENILRFGNWIGSSNNFFGSTKQTITWNLYKIEDQWGNNLVFEYDTVEQGTAPFLQTEASYLKKVISSNGANIQLTYGTKDADEYYEPHQETAEPDAYQERYEKKYLQSVSSYNTEEELVSKYDLGHTLNGMGLNKKRYLTSLTQTSYKGSTNEALPPQEFEYHDTGIYKGGIKTVTYPTGGSVTYNYNNKLLFTNTFNMLETPFVFPGGYEYYSTYVSDNYSLFVLRTSNAVTGDKYRFKFYRFWWNGEKWERNEFTFPYLIEDFNTVNAGGPLKDFYAVLERDFYGFAIDRGTVANIYLFSLNKDGRTWNYYTHSANIGSGNPSFLSGNDFAALACHETGNLYTYTKNGTSWKTKTISQGSGQEYYYAATENYIMALDEDGYSSGDMVTGQQHSDYYYMHYLDAEKQWQTKSWSAAADPYISGISDPSYLYPSNSIIGFMADNNPEFFLRWDTNYNLTSVDNVLGSYNDVLPMQPVANNMLTLYNSWYKCALKSARFNGIGWSINTLPSSSSTYYAKLNFGEDLMTFQNHPTISGIGYNLYNPNTNTWSYGSIGNTPSSGQSTSAINKDFTVAGNYIYERLNQTASNPFSQIGILQGNNTFSHSDGLSHSFVRQDNINKGSFLYIDKNTGLLETIDLGDKEHLSGTTKIGGYTPFMSPNAIWLSDDFIWTTTQYFYRIIDDKLDGDVHDIVVNHIDINDDNGGLRKVQYTYNKPKPSPDNSTTYYGEVIIENKGIGTGNIGKVKKIFNNGEADLLMAGLPIEIHILDANNNLLKKTINIWKKTYSYVYNSLGNLIDRSYYIRATGTKEELFLNGTSVISESTSSYNTKGLKSSTISTDSKGKTIQQNIYYAHDQYTFVNDKNMMSFPYKTITKVNGQVVNVEESKWVNDNGKVYINENWSGPSVNDLRLNSQISKVETEGNVVENNNGKGLYNAVLYGYDNLHEVATISNAKYQDVIDELDVAYAQLQDLGTSGLKAELLKLYDRLPNSFISLSFYDDNGRVISRINERKEESHVYLL